MNLTCYHCGGTTFVLVVLEDADTQIECVDHDEHVAELFFDVDNAAVAS